VSAESGLGDRDGARPGQAGHSTGSVEAAGGPARRWYQVPVVKELPRRWDPLIEGEIVVRGTD
jgi:hypothetical protein